MLDNLNKSLAYLIPQKAQEISEKFAELKEILESTEKAIFSSFWINEEKFSGKINGEIETINNLTKPYWILKEGRDFIVRIKEEIAKAKKGKKRTHIFTYFAENKKLFMRFLEEHKEWSFGNKNLYIGYKLKTDGAIDLLPKSLEEKNAYKAIRDGIQKFIKESEEKGIGIGLSPGNYPINGDEERTEYCDLIIRLYLSEDFLNNEKPKNIESLEALEEAPELEAENYKIDKDMSVEEKLKNGWTRERDSHGIIYLQKDLSPEQQYKDNKAYVREYLEGVDKEYIGEQKFNRYAVKKLGLIDKLPKNFKEFKKIRGNNHQDFLNKYFSKNNKFLLSGYRNRGGKGFIDIGDEEHCWLSNGRSVQINKNNIAYYGNNRCFGFSLRLVKGR